MQPYLGVTTLWCPNTASLMEGWPPEGSNPGRRLHAGYIPPYPPLFLRRDLVGRCLGAVPTGGSKKGIKNT